MTEQQPVQNDEYERTPLTRAEYISAIVHLYRGEMHRATLWRIRLDTTTNWAVLTVAGLLAFTFRDAGNTHWALLVGMLLITLLMSYEARRFRFFDLWRARVRKIEENFYGPILLRDPVSPQRDWGKLVAGDLLEPRFKLTFLSALRARLTRNYWAIYAVLLLSWVLKIVNHSRPPHRWADIRAYLQTGALPWWAPVAFIAAFLSGLGLLMLLVPRERKTEEEYWYTKVPDSDVPELDV